MMQDAAYLSKTQSFRAPKFQKKTTPVAAIFDGMGGNEKWPTRDVIRIRFITRPIALTRYSRTSSL